MTRPETARTNGALSHGPVTGEGKARSAQNACKRGPTSADVVIRGEDQDAFEDSLQCFTFDYTPATVREADLVLEIAACRWRIRRLIVMEKAAVELEMDRIRSTEEGAGLSAEALYTKAFATEAVSSAMRQIHRHWPHPLHDSLTLAAQKRPPIQSRDRKGAGFKAGLRTLVFAGWHRFPREPRKKRVAN